MKKALRLAVLTAVVVLVLGSCSAVLGVVFPNQFELSGAAYTVDKLYILNYGQFGTANHYLDIWLVSDGISVDANAVASGAGDQISFYTISATPTLGEGTITYGGDFFGAAGTMYEGSPVYIGANYSASVADATYTLNGGTLDVSRSRVGDDYIIDFEGTTDTGLTVTAHYRGPLEGNVITVPTPSQTPKIQ